MKLIECVCPRCECVHKVKIEWTGNGMPRKYCPRCRERVERAGEQYESAILPFDRNTKPRLG